jgi:manganese transport protein
VWLRRLVTVVPSLVVIGLGLDPTRTLVISQVVLSFGLPFAIVPLVLFTADRRLMGVLANRRLTTAATGLMAALIIGLNAYLLVKVFSGG